MPPFGGMAMDFMSLNPNFLARDNIKYLSMWRS